MKGQWTIPIVLGMLAAGVTWVAVPDELGRTDSSGAAEVRSDAPYVLVPAVDHDATLLRYGAADARHGLGGILDVHGGRAVNGVFWWDGHGWECVRETPCAPRPVEPVPIGVAARIGDAGMVSAANSTLELTFYAFTSDGHLLATNALRSQWEHYDLHGEFTRFSQTTWHLGDGPAPEGAQALPMWRAEALAVLDGTPVGGVQSVVLEQHEYDWLVGPVWVTARVDAIATA